jgi:hypothetical protein
MMMSALARTVDLPHGAPKRLDLAFVCVFLPLEDLQHFQYFFHFIQGRAKCLNYNANLLNGLLDRSGGGRLAERRERLGRFSFGLWFRMSFCGDRSLSRVVRFLG